jgi:hypothetical protein
VFWALHVQKVSSSKASLEQTSLSVPMGEL